MDTRKIKTFVLGIWAFAGGGVIVLGVLFFGGIGADAPPGGRSSPSGESPPTATHTAAETSPPPVTATRSPTSEPSPTSPSTPSPPPTSTPSPSPEPTFTPTLPLISAQPIVIGHSVAGHPLEVYRFGRGRSERMIVAGIHEGYEWNTIALADELMAYFQQYPQKIPSGVTLYILRSLNPDGRARSQGAAGRANENGVDINRNFPAFWQADWPREGCWSYMPISAGRTPASEPETKALMNFVRAHSIEALISYHSAGLGIFHGGKEPDPASIHLAEAVASVSAYPYPPINTGCMYTGQLTDWASLEGIPAVDIELTNHQDTDFEQNLEILSVFLNWEGFNQGG